MARRKGYRSAVAPVARPDPLVKITPRALVPDPNDPADDPHGSSDPASPVNDEAFQNLVRSAIDAATEYDETQIQPDRLRNRRFYLGDMEQDLPAIPDGSSVVSRDVRDVIQAILPSMVRIFCSGDEICEFVPTKPEQVASARQATEYINFLIADRLGVKSLVDVFTDACLSKVGVVKWWWDESTRVEEAEYSGLTPADMGLVLTPVDDDEKIELISYTQSSATQSMILPSEDNTQPTLQVGMPLFDCRIRRLTATRELRIEAVPPEERRIDPKARTLAQARFWFHVMTKTRGELVDMGYAEDFIDEHATGNEDDVSNTQERALRQPSSIDPASEDLPGRDQQDIYYCEGYIRCDRDGDGHEELVRVCTIGNAYAIAHEETVDQICAAEFQSITQPHIATGRAVADDLIDIQMAKSGLQRNVMESLPHSVYPRLAIVDGNVNIDDVLSTQPGTPVRITSQGDVAALTVPFVGDAALNVIQYYDQVRERRTGISDASQGLDPDALQSTPEGAAAAIVTASQLQVEMLARMLAETGFKPLFRGLLRDIVKNQNRPDMIQLEGTWIDMDPRPWNADMNVRVRAGLGRGSDQTKLQALGMVKQTQEAIIQQGGPTNPLVALPQYVKTLSQMCKILGLANPADYFNQQPQPPPPPPPPPPPVELQVQQAKAQADAAKLQQTMPLDWAKWETAVFFQCLDVAAKLGIQPPPAVDIINAIRSGQVQALPNESTVQPYPVAPPTPAISPVTPPSGYVVPRPHIAGAGALVPALR